MMKFLAILRDSVREALDFKVIYFLFGLSLLVIVLFASVSYRPESGEKGLQSVVNRLPGRRPDPFGGPMPLLNYEIEDFKQVDPSRPVWDSEFSYTLIVRESGGMRRGEAGVVVAEVKDDKVAPNKEQPDKEQPDKNKDDKKQLDKNKEDKKPEAPPERKISSLRVWVLRDLLREAFRKKPDERTTEENAILGRLARIDNEAKKKIEKLSGGGKEISRAALGKVMGEALEEGAKVVTTDQITQFLKTNLATAGTMDVTDVSLVEEKDSTFRFKVSARGRPDMVRTWPHIPVLFFGALELPYPTGIAPWVMGIEQWVVTGSGAGLTMLLSTIITAFFIPNMMRKGTIDLLISKPLPRWYLLVCKYIGGMTFMFVNTVIIILGIWLVLGLRTGLWAPGFLVGILTLTIQFGILYAVSVLVGVLTRSPIASILTTCLWWFILFGVGSVYVVTDQLRDLEFLPKWVHTTVDTAHLLLPRYKDFDFLAQQVIANDLLPEDNPQRELTNKMFKSINWPASLGVTFGFIVLVLGLTSWRFAVKDY